MRETTAETNAAAPLQREPVPASKEAAAKSRTQSQDSSYQNYLFAGARSGDAPAWSDTKTGRAMIRLVSRGIMGATFFAVGGRMANTQLKNYDHTATWNWNKPLQVVAKAIDTTLGRGIEKTVTSLAGLKYGAGSQVAKDIGRRAVTFRESRNFPNSGIAMGRSYGADIVGFTFDFAMASIGDAGTRNIIQGLDPNIRKTWLVNDNGEPAKTGERKHFLPGEWLKAVGKSAWCVFSKNQGEDWAAAIPYAFQMKFQRQFLGNIFNKRWQGHELVFDHGWNGGAYRMNQQGKIVGDYQLVGAIDLHARFVGYNWYTLMFREGYDAIGRAFNQWKENGFKLSIPVPEHFNPITTPIDGALHAARYVTKSFIKANMYMNPAVIPFWLMRVPQSRWRGKQFIEGEPPRYGTDTNMHQPGGLDPYATSNYEHYKTDTRFDRAEKWISKNIFTPIGKMSFAAGEGVGKATENYLRTNQWETKTGWLPRLLKGEEATIFAGGRRLAHEIVDASFSYTPYMYAKQEFGLRVDEKKASEVLGTMDVAIYKFMDDVASLKFKAIPADLKKMWTLGSNFEREIKVREGGDSGVTPKTQVQGTSIQRNNAGPAANDEQQWTKRVAGSDISPASHSRANHLAMH